MTKDNPILDSALGTTGGIVGAALGLGMGGLFIAIAIIIAVLGSVTLCCLLVMWMATPV